LSTSPETLRKKVSLIRESASLVSQRELPPSFHKMNSQLKDLVKTRRDTSKKLLTLGAALLIMPDPITDAAAVPVLIAGKVMQARQSINIKKVYEELNSSLSQISSFGSP